MNCSSQNHHQSGVMDCPCQDPMVPIQGTGERWTDTHMINQRMTQSERAIQVDVVFFGDSITEAWRETELGVTIPRAKGSAAVFDTLFSKAKGGKYKGLPLGIAGDTVRKRNRLVSVVGFLDFETVNDYILALIQCVVEITDAGGVLLTIYVVSHVAVEDTKRRAPFEY